MPEFVAGSLAPISQGQELSIRTTIFRVESSEWRGSYGIPSAEKQEMTESTDPLVEVLLEETADTLQVVVQHEEESWEILYVRDAVQDQIERWETGFGEIIEQFRRDAAANRRREEVFDAGAFYCSLHLFDEVLIIHFSRSSGEGILFGYNPDAAPNLTSFVDLCLPYIHRQLDKYAPPRADLEQ